jgi:hypothetical protein
MSNVRHPINMGGPDNKYPGHPVINQYPLCTPVLNQCTPRSPVINQCTPRSPVLNQHPPRSRAVELWFAPAVGIELLLSPFRPPLALRARIEAVSQA